MRRRVYAHVRCARGYSGPATALGQLATGTAVPGTAAARGPRITARSMLSIDIPLGRQKTSMPVELASQFTGWLVCIVAAWWARTPEIREGRAMADWLVRGIKVRSTSLRVVYLKL